MEELTSFWDSLKFINPIYFWIGGALILLLVFIPWSRKRRGLGIDLAYWKQHVSLKSRKFWILSIPIVIVSILLACCLASPQMVTRTKSLIVGKPVMLVIDVSGSTIAATESHPEMTGQEAARHAFYSLIDLRADINFGLILYSTKNYVSRYFTYKNELFKGTLDDEYTTHRMAKGTRTAEALETARKFLARNIGEGEDKAIVLISDLNFDKKGLSDTLEEIEKDLLINIKVYIISTSGEEKGMSQMPEAEGLMVMDIYDTNSVAQMYRELSAMKTTPIRSEETLSITSLIPFIMPPVLGVIILCLILGETRFRKIP